MPSIGPNQPRRALRYGEEFGGRSRAYDRCGLNEGPTVTIYLDRAVEDVVNCPVGAAFLSLVDTNLTVAQAVTPRASFALAARAVSYTSPWASNHAQMLKRSLRLGGRLRDLARELLAHPDAVWWSAPYEGTQLWIGYGDHPNAPIELDDQRAAKEIRWQTHAQRPLDWQMTSRMLDGLANLDFAARGMGGGGDWMPDRLWRAPIEPIEGARVLEVVSPADWHRLCVDYPSPLLTGRDSPAGEGVLAPHWGAVGRAWDGVHLTFLGLLTTPFVRTNSTEGASMLWSWDSEGTLWLRRNLLRPALGPIPLADAEDPTRALALLPGPLFALADIDPDDRSMVLLRAGGSEAPLDAGDRESVRRRSESVLREMGYLPGPQPRWRMWWWRLARWWRGR